MHRQELSPSDRWRRPLWLALLVASSVIFTLGFACAVPLAAFAGAAALTLPRRQALLLIVAVWLANQVVGFAMLSYPWDAETLAWGGALGGVAVLSTLAAQAATRRSARAGTAAAAAAFAAAFVVYEGALFAISLGLGATADFTPDIVAWILAMNAGAMLGLVLLHRLGELVGLAPAALPMRARPA
ncbi:MAG TPA: hypothetical protein VJ747_10130 [Stellaceae bacterium]|nr:hypothetical protein [Stellaceae bacterium]